MVVVGATVVGATDVVVVGATVVVVVGTVVVVAAEVVVATRVLVVDGSEVVVDASAVDVAVAVTVVTFGSSTNGSLGSGRPAIATPARPPTTITTIANGHDLRISEPSYRRTVSAGQRRATATSTLE
jgi:hypothetical protein